LAAIILGRPLSLLWQWFFMFKQVEAPTLIDVTVLHIAVYLLIPVLLGKNRLRALISASFAFSIVNITHLPVLYFVLLIVSPFIGSLSILNFLQQNPQIHFFLLFFTNIIITLSCIYAAHFLRKTKLKPPIKIYVSFNLLFVLFPLAVLLFFEDVMSVMSISILSSAIICTLFLVIILFLFYLYTRLASDNPVVVEKETDTLLPLSASEGVEYAPFIKHLSKRELEVIEAVLAGNLSYKELSSALNVSVNTVKAHLKHIYKTTGISSIAALSYLFRGFTTHDHQ
jgi:DNA-binding CsgD family transcriptional regulator